MEAATHPPFTVVHADPEALPPTRIRVEGDRIVVERLVIRDLTLAGFVGERPAADRADLVERATRIGLLALQDAGVTVNVDVVRARVREARPPGRDRSTRRPPRRSSRRCGPTSPTATVACPGHSRSSWATAARCAGWSRSCSTRRSATARSAGSAAMLERYFDGDASKLAVLLDPTRLNSPMHQFRQEITAGFKRPRGAPRRDRGGRRRPPRWPTSRSSSSLEPVADLGPELVERRIHAGRVEQDERASRRPHRSTYPEQAGACGRWRCRAWSRRTGRPTIVRSAPRSPRNFSRVRGSLPSPSAKFWRRTSPRAARAAFLLVCSAWRADHALELAPNDIDIQASRRHPGARSGRSARHTQKSAATLLVGPIADECRQAPVKHRPGVRRRSGRHRRERGSAGTASGSA